MVMMPGTDTTMVVKNTLAKGVKGGQATTLGIASGLVVHTMTAILGLSAIISSSPLLFEIIKYAGVAYLFYLGVTTLVSTKRGLASTIATTSNEVVTDIDYSQNKSSYIQGLFSNVLNPKSFVFYFTFLPQFIETNKNYFTQLVFLASILIIFAMVWFFILTFLLDLVRVWLKKPIIITTIQRVLGGILIIFAFKLVLEKI